MTMDESGGGSGEGTDSGGPRAAFAFFFFGLVARRFSLSGFAPHVAAAASDEGARGGGGWRPTWAAGGMA